MTKKLKIISLKVPTDKGNMSTVQERSSNNYDSWLWYKHKYLDGSGLPTIQKCTGCLAGRLIEAYHKASEKKI